MKAFFLILISILLLLHFSCNQEEKPTQAKVMDSVEVITDTVAIKLPPCIYPPLPMWTDSTIYINTNEDYQKLDRDNGCSFYDNYKLPYVNFQNRTVIGLMIITSTSGRKVWERNFKKYNYEKRLEYEINLVRYVRKIDEGPALYAINLYSIPKIPNDFVVVFKKKYVIIQDTL